MLSGMQSDPEQCKRDDVENHQTSVQSSDDGIRNQSYSYEIQLERQTTQVSAQGVKRFVETTFQHDSDTRVRTSDELTLIE